MVLDIFKIRRVGGGSYTGTVFAVAYTDPIVNIAVTSIEWILKDQELAIDIPETTAGNTPKTIAGGFKRQTITLKVEGFLDPDIAGDSAKVALEKLWNIAEYGDPTKTYGAYRGFNLFNLIPGTDEGQLKVVSLSIMENALISEPATGIISGTSQPQRVKIRLEMRKVQRSL
jgi:hypothetical protein